MEEYIYFKCSYTHSPTTIYSRTGNSIYEGTKLIVTWSTEAKAIADLERRQKYEKLPYFKFPATMRKELTVDGKLYCPFHVPWMIAQQENKAWKSWDKWMSVYRKVISGGKTIET